MIHKFNYKEKCWWCGKPADSREHKFKKTDFSRLWKNQEWNNENQPIHINSKGARIVKGANSNALKFARNLCKRCNDTKSQPFDHAYDLFLNYVQVNLYELLEEKKIRLEDVYGVNWYEQKLNLLRYYTKHACCRIASGSFKISERILDFLNGKQPIGDINILFQFNLGTLGLRESYKQQRKLYGHMYMGRLIFHKHADTSGVHSLFSWYSYEGLTVNFLYCLDFKEELYPKYLSYYDQDYIPIQIYDTSHIDLTGVNTAEEQLIAYECSDIKGESKYKDELVAKMLNRNQFI